MAIIRRGKMKGIEVELSQWCNDWFSTKSGVIIRPTNLILTPEEMEQVRNSDTGVMFDEFELHDDGTFTRRGRARH